MYVPVKGGDQAISASRIGVERARRGDEEVTEIATKQIIEQMGLAVDRVMTEGGLYDRRLAAIALKQAQGDIAEAVFLIRAHRARLPNFGTAEPIDLDRLRRTRHISATQKELVGGQILGATYDYTHRLLDFGLEAERQAPVLPEPVASSPVEYSASIAGHADLIRQEAPQGPVDITRKALGAQPDASERLAHLARGEEGYLTGLAYESMRKASAAHPYVAQLAAGSIEVLVVLEDIGLTVSLGDIELTACTTLKPDFGSDPHLIEGFGIAFGANERKAVAMAVVDQKIKSNQSSSEVLMHADGVAASGYVSHLKLPHYSDFDSDVARMRRVRNKDSV